MLINTKIDDSFEEYPIRSSQTDITAEGPWVKAKHDDIKITVIVARRFCR